MPRSQTRPPRTGRHAAQETNKIALSHVHAAGEEARHNHSSKRVTVEHALADHKRWKQLTRWTHRREVLSDAYRATAGLVTDRNTTTT